MRVQFKLGLMNYIGLSWPMMPGYGMGTPWIRLEHRFHTKETLHDAYFEVSMHH